MNYNTVLSESQIVYEYVKIFKNLIFLLISQSKNDIESLITRIILKREANNMENQILTGCHYQAERLHQGGDVWRRHGYT